MVDEFSDQNVLIRILRRMILIREIEEFIAKRIELGITKCPCQEARPSVLAEFLTPEDKVYGTYRAHNQYLAI